MTAVVQREQSTTMASMGGFGNNIIVSHRIHRGSQTGAGAGRPPVDPTVTAPSSSGPLLLTPPQARPYPQPDPQASSNASEQLAPMWGPQVLPGPQPSSLSLTVDTDDVFDGGQVDNNSLPGPSSSSLLLSSPSSSSSSSSSSSHSPLPSGSSSRASPSGYHGDPYSR